MHMHNALLLALMVLAYVAPSAEGLSTARLSSSRMRFRSACPLFCDAEESAAVIPTGVDPSEVNSKEIIR